MVVVVETHFSVKLEPQAEQLCCMLRALHRQIVNGSPSNEEVFMENGKFPMKGI